jgi:signal transduction histidine kinase
MEISVAATKTFVAQVAAMYLLGLKLAELRGTLLPERIAELIAEMKSLPSKVEATLAGCEERVREVSAAYSDQQFFLYLGRHIMPGLPHLFVDRLRLKQVLLNLLSNAVKFTPEHGRITVFARCEEDGGMVVGVSDTGVGIAQEDQAKVFDNFGQGKHDVAIADKGTGLGLAIVKGLVESHGGHVRLESQLGKGTRVTVHMPPSRVHARVRSGAMAIVA